MERLVKTLASYLFFIGFIIRMYVNPEKSTMYLLLGLGIQLLNSIRACLLYTSTSALGKKTRFRNARLQSFED